MQFLIFGLGTFVFLFAIIIRARRIQKIVDQLPDLELKLDDKAFWLPRKIDPKNFSGDERINECFPIPLNKIKKVCLFYWTPRNTPLKDGQGHWMIEVFFQGSAPKERRLDMSLSISTAQAKEFWTELEKRLGSKRVQFHFGREDLYKDLPP